MTTLKPFPKSFSNLFESSNPSAKSISKVTDTCYLFFFDEAKDLLNSSFTRDEIK